jgi:small-conductance mechanosensitive channel
LQVLGIGLLSYVGIRAIEVLIDQFFDAIAEGQLLEPKASQRLALRVSTFSRVIKSVVTIVFTFVGGLAALSVVGVDLIPLLAGAGIIGIAISFASQSIIKDMINGFLILLEDQYAVGDVITVGEVSGLVENMNLRITQLRNNEGRLITIPNSAIAVVQNLSKDWSRVDIAIDLAYGTDPDRALEVIRQVGESMYSDREWRSKMPEAPEVLGIDELDHTGILIRVWLKTQPLQQWKVGREFRRRLKYALDEAGIEIGSPQQALWFRSHDSSMELDEQFQRQLQFTGAERDRR